MSQRGLFDEIPDPPDEPDPPPPDPPPAPPLFDRPAAEAARDDAIDQAGEREGGDWAERAYRAVSHVCRQCEEFTTDDVLKAAPELESCPERRVLGAAMQAAKRDKLCLPTDRYGRSDRVQSHARPKRIWRSLIVHPSE